MTERELFLHVLDLPDEAARATYLDRVCGTDTRLRGRIKALLHSHETAGSFLTSPAVSRPILDGDSWPSLGEEDTPCNEKILIGDALRYLSPSDRADALGRLGNHEILEVLGQGGFGIVFRAFDDLLERVVAIKVLSPAMAASRARQRFLREARSNAAVHHENVVQVFAVHELPLPHLVMEFVPGETLQEHLERVGPLPVDLVLHIGRQVAAGLAAAHQKGLIHRDVKPGNILLQTTEYTEYTEKDQERREENDPGRSLAGRGWAVGTAGASSSSLSVSSVVPPSVKLTDFGLARAADATGHNQSGAVTGTPLFMAPEQVRNEPIDYRADLFGLGSVLYTMCTGVAPFRADSMFAVLKRVVEDDPTPLREVRPDVPEWLADFIARLHRKDPAERPASAAEVAELLARWQTEPPRPTPREPETLTGRRPRQVLAAAVVFLAVLGLSGAVVRLFAPGGTRAVQQEEPAAEFNDPDRRAAQWLCSLDSVECDVVEEGSGDRQRIFAGRPLPKGPFRLWDIWLQGPDVERLGDELADHLAVHLAGVHPLGAGLPRSLSTAGVAKVLRVPALARVSRLSLAGDHVDDRVFDPLALLSHLEDLSVSSRRLTGKGVHQLKACSRFRMLSLLGSRLTVEAMEELGQLPRLEYLNLSQVPCSAAHAAALGRLQLTHLVFASAGIDDDMAAELSRITTLQKLNLPRNPLGDRGLEALQRLEQLEELDLALTSVTADGVARFQKALPRCRVMLD